MKSYWNPPDPRSEPARKLAGACSGARPAMRSPNLEKQQKITLKPHWTVKEAPNRLQTTSKHCFALLWNGLRRSDALWWLHFGPNSIFWMKIIKIPSGEITNKPFIDSLVSFNKPMILSTGMATLKEVSLTIDWIKEARKLYKIQTPLKEMLTILHCTS